MYLEFKVNKITEINEHTARVLGNIPLDFIYTNLITPNLISNEKIVKLKLSNTYIVATYRFVKKIKVED